MLGRRSWRRTETESVAASTHGHDRQKLRAAFDASTERGAWLHKQGISFSPGWKSRQAAMTPLHRLDAVKRGATGSSITKTPPVDVRMGVPRRWQGSGSIVSATRPLPTALSECLCV
jgi:hypothetical protein